MKGKASLWFPIGLLITGAGGVTPSLTQISLPSWSFGGGHLYLKDVKELGSPLNKLQLQEKEIKQFVGKNVSAELSNKLEINSRDDSLKIMETQLKTNEPQRDISEIFSELKREKEVQTIDVAAQSKLTTTRASIKNKDYQEFKKALNKVNQFNSKNTTITPRADRSISIPKIQKLTNAEKTSISNFFDRFKNLDQERDKFSESLVKAAGGERSSKLQSKACLSCIPGNLKKISWTGQDLNLFEKRSTFRSNRMNAYYHYSANRAPDKSKAKLAWGDWAELSNPYHSFFNSEEEWLEAVEKISKAWRSYYSYMNNSGRIATSLFTFGSYGSGDKSKLEKSIEEAKSSLELQIGSKLMNLMKRLS